MTTNSRELDLNPQKKRLLSANALINVTSSGEISNQILDDLEAVEHARKVIDLTITTTKNISFLEEGRVR